MWLIVALRHNPYFNRWFSAIKQAIMWLIVALRHNPYFNRWFSAIKNRLYNNF